MATESLTQVFARQLRAARDARDWSSADLAERIVELGFDRPSAGRIRQIEAMPDRARVLRLDEVIACAAALEVAPVHLFCPLDDHESIEFGNMPVPAGAFRNWVRGLAPIGGDLDSWEFFYFTFAPQSQRRRLMAEAAKEETPPGYPEGSSRAPFFLARTRAEQIKQLILDKEGRDEQ